MPAKRKSLASGVTITRSREYVRPELVAADADLALQALWQTLILGERVRLTPEQKSRIIIVCQELGRVTEQFHPNFPRGG